MKVLDWIKETWWAKILVAIIVIVIFAAIMDKIVMPLYVQLGDEVDLPDVIEMPIAIGVGPEGGQVNITVDRKE